MTTPLQSQTDRGLVESTFGLSDSIVAVYGVGNPEGSNMLTTTNMLTLYDAWDNISTTDSYHSDGTPFNLTGVCRLLAGQCQKSTVLAFWQYNRTLIASQSDAALWQTLVDANYTTTEQDGKAVNLSDVAYVRDSQIISTRFRIVLADLKEDDLDDDGESDKVNQWSKTLKDLVYTRTWGSLKLYSDSFVELGEEASGPLGNDLLLLPVGYILLVIYSTVVLSRNSKVHTHGSLALASFASCGIATIAAFGAGMWLGATFANIIFTLAFLLIGLGTDDTFVLVAAFQHPDVVNLHPRERVSEAMARAGSSIAVTSITDLIAFLCGSITTIPAVRAFCQYAAIGVTLDFFLQVTFFSAVMYMSAQREEKNKYDWLCCIMSSAPEKKRFGKGDFDREMPEMQTIFLGKVYAPRLLTSAGKTVALAIGALLLGLNIWACTQIQMDFQFEVRFSPLAYAANTTGLLDFLFPLPQWFVADDSYLQDMFAVRDRYWGRLGNPVTIYTFGGEYSSEETQIQFSKVTTELANYDQLVSNSCVNWWSAYIDYAEANNASSIVTVDGQKIVTTGDFDSTFLSFYNSGDGQAFADFVFLESNEIVRTKINCIETQTADMTGEIKIMDRMREIADILSSVSAVALGPGFWSRDAHKVSS